MVSDCGFGQMRGCFQHHLRVGGTPMERMRMASGALSSGAAAAGGGGPLFGCRRRNSCAGVCPKWLIWSSTACRCMCESCKGN